MSAALEFDAVVKSYATPSGVVEALRGVTFTVRRGEIFGVIGRSGAGKTTLIRCANLVERPDKGAIRVAGTALTDLSGRALDTARRGIGMIFQHFNLLSSRTALDNVALPLEIAGWGRADARKRAAELLARVGLADKLDVYPAKLSGGQKQRVGVARALANDPAILLCDEATSALDPETTVQILDLLRDLRDDRGLTIVLITHEMGVLKHVADRVAVLDGGKVVESGDVYDVFVAPQSDVARKFVAEVAGGIVPARYADAAKRNPGIGERTLVDLTYDDRVAGDAVLSILSRRFGLDVEIVGGRVDTIGKRPFGRLALLVKGAEDRVTQALGSLRAEGAKAEVLGHVGANVRAVA